MNRAITIALNILRQIRNDKRTVGMIVVTPILIMVLFGYAFAGEPKELKIAVVNEDTGTAMFQTLEGPIISITPAPHLGNLMISFVDKEAFNLNDVENAATAEQMIKDGETWGAIHFPPQFTQHLINKVFQITNQSTIFFNNTYYKINPDTLPTTEAFVMTYVDNSNTQIGSIIQRKVSEAFTKMSSSVSPNATFAGLLQSTYIYGANAKFVDFFAPGIMAFITTMITIMLTIVSIVRERTNGTMDRVFASPTRPHEVVFGYMLAFSVIILIQSSLLLGSAILLFNMTIVGNVFFALAFIVLYAIGIQGLGTLLSTVARNEFQAIQLVPLVFVPFILLGGIFWPIEAMPSFIRPLSSAIPLTYAAEGLRSIIIRGWGPLEVWDDLLALIIFALVMFLISLIVTKRRARGG